MEAMNFKIFISTSTVVLLLSAFLSLVDLRALSPRPSNHENVVVVDAAGNGFIPIEGAVGPESLAFDPNGVGPYTGVSDGRIIKWLPHQRRWIDFAVTSPHRDGCVGSHDHVQKEHICGRPLGLCFDERTGDLYVADAYMGLLVVGPDGGLASKIETQTQAQGIGFRFSNSVDVDQKTQVVYFTDSSTLYQRRNYISSTVSGDNTGRLMKYDPITKSVSVLLTNLSFPNGVALSETGDFILVAESTTCRILRLWLRTPRSGSVDVFAELPGFPDNIKRREKGGFWVGIHGRRTKPLQWLLSCPWIGKALVKLPIDITRVYSYLAWWRRVGLAVRLSENGEALEVWEDKGRDGLKFVSEVEERDGVLWVGSIQMPFVGIRIRQKLI